ncbi:MAG: flagellar basal body rod protein FlgB [Defluviitaleaceae bacterium]|nr:flagellar basal body rod protein FlgB [Defluviitaleaceae bacterium]
MVLNNIFLNNEILGQSLKASQLRNTVISHNIANVDVVGFRRSLVEFENILETELTSAREENRRVNLKNVSPVVHISAENTMHRNDGNNVDIEMEMVALYQNSARYEVMSMSLMNNYRRINVVLNSNI